MTASASALAQDAEQARLARTRDRLMAQLAAAPDDTGALCELGLVRTRLGEADAVAPLSRAIALLVAPRSAALDRRLAACLYNRGQALVAAGDVDGARTDFARSLSLREHPSVTQRLAALPPVEQTLGRVETVPSLPADVRAFFGSTTVFGAHGGREDFVHAAPRRGSVQEAWVVLVDGIELVIRTASGLSRVAVPGTFSRCARSPSPALELAPGPRGSTLFLLTMTCTESRDEDDVLEEETETVVSAVWARADGSFAARQVASSLEAFRDGERDDSGSREEAVWPSTNGVLFVESRERTVVIDTGAL